MKGNDKIAEISLIGHVKVPVIKKLHRKTSQFPSCEAQNGQIQMVGTSRTHRAEENWIKKESTLRKTRSGMHNSTWAGRPRD
jgi:hypothetical protein